MTRSRRWKLLGAVLLIILPALLFLRRHYQDQRALAAFKRDLRAQGEPLTWQQIVPPAPAPEDNAAGPLISAAGGLSAIRGGFPPTFWMVAPGKVLVSPGLEDWRDFSYDSADKTGTNLNWTAATGSLSRAAPWLEKVHAALQRPRLDHQLNYSLGSILLPHLYTEKNLSQWLAMASLAELRAGRNTGALTNLLDLCALVRLQGEEPLPISQLVRAACASFGLGVTWQMLQCPGWSEAQLADLQRGLESFELISTMLVAIQGERIYGLTEYQLSRNDSKRVAQALDNVEKDRSGEGGVFAMLDGTVGAGFRHAVYPRIWKFCWADQDELRFLQQFQRTAGDARLKLMQRKVDASNSVPDSMVSPLLRDCRFPISSENPDVDWMRTTAEKALRLEAQREMAVTAIALARHHLRYGRYPTNLEELVPEFIPRLPLDSMDGQPLRYRLKSEGGFLLYSVGLDGRDDGGDPSPDDAHKSERPSFESGRDLVWPQPATETEITAYREKWLKK